MAAGDVGDEKLGEVLYELPSDFPTPNFYSQMSFPGVGVTGSSQNQQYTLPNTNSDGGIFSTSSVFGDDSSIFITETSSNSVSSRNSLGDDEPNLVSEVSRPIASETVKKIITVPPTPPINNNDTSKSMQLGNGPIDSLLKKLSIFSGDKPAQKSEPSLMKSLSSSSLHSAESSQRKEQLKPSPLTTTHSSSCSPVHSRPQSHKLPNHAASCHSTSAVSTQGLIYLQRPANLPPKDPKEEQKHLDLYNEMMEEQKKRDLEKEKLLQKKQDLKYRHEDDMSQLQHIWFNEIIPNWNEMKHSGKVQDMWWMGLPPKVRTKLWPLAIGNDLNITRELFKTLDSKSTELIKLLSARTDGNTSPSKTPSEDPINLIRLDVSRTFVRYKVFQEDPLYRDALQKLLVNFVCYRHDINYVQGMNNIAAILLLNMDLEDAFMCFANLINRRPVLMAFFRLDIDKINRYYRLFHHLLQRATPKLYSHFKNIMLTPEHYFLQWVLSLYSKALPLDIATRIWDVYFRDGDSFIFRVALGLLKLFESELLSISDFTDVAQFFNKIPEATDCNELFSHIKSISLSKTKFDKLCDKIFAS